MERRSFVKLLGSGIAAVGAAATAKAIAPIVETPVEEIQLTPLQRQLSEKEAMAKLLSQMDLSAAQWTDDSKIYVEKDGVQGVHFQLKSPKGGLKNWNAPYQKIPIKKQ